MNMPTIKDMMPDSIKKIVRAKIDLMRVNDVVKFAEDDFKHLKSSNWISTARNVALTHPLCYSARHKYKTSVRDGCLLIGRAR